MNIGAGTCGGDGAAARRRPLVVVAPFPPSQNGIAAYVSELMPFHMETFDVTLVIADDAALPEATGIGPRVLLASEFRKHRALFETVPKLYHVGNNPDHCYMLDLIERDPGIVVLHDFNLNYMHEVASRDRQRSSGRLSFFEREYGVLGSGQVRSRFERKDRGLFATYELPLNGDILEYSTGIVAHSRYVQYRAAARVPGKPVWYLPHHFSPVAGNYIGTSQAEARRELGLPQDEIIITAPGFITYAKRIPVLLSALAGLRSRIPPFRLILAGERCPDQYDVDADIAAMGLIGIASCTGYLDEASFFKHLVACDIVANLRHPSGGETSGTLIRALGMGAPAIIFDNGPMAELPDTVVWKVAWDGNTESALAGALYELISDRKRRLEQGARAAAHVRELHAPEKCAARYAKILQSAAALSSHPTAEAVRETVPHPKAVARRLLGQNKGALLQFSAGIDGRFWWRCAKAPLGQSGRRALVLGANPQSTAQFLSRVFEWPPSQVTSLSVEAFLEPSVRDSSGVAIPQEAFAYALVVAPMALSEIEASVLLRRLNASLERDGSITFEVWSALDSNLDDCSLPEDRIPERLTDAGFANVVRTKPSEALFTSVAAPPEPGSRRYACFTGRKASGFSLWRFNQVIEGTPLFLGGRIP